MTTLVEVRPGTYQDSVTLMQLSKQLQQRAGVNRALVSMATELNLELLADLGFDRPVASSPNDLLVAIDADGPDQVAAAVAELDAALTARPSTATTGENVPPAPTIRVAARRVEADLALVSTPGRVAVLDAVDAIESGLDVMVFSDNVSVAQEIALKQLAAAHDRLVMGPDCGTAVIGGVGLGFANVVRPGPVGIVAASGTGAQHLMSLLDDADVGIAHCLGVGGRDLSAAVGGLSTLAALRRLDADPAVELIVVISKPPDEAVAARIEQAVGELATPVMLAPLGPGRPDLTSTAKRVSTTLGAPWHEPPSWGAPRGPARPGSVRGLFAGGTLCDEAMLVALPHLGRIASNIPLPGQPSLGDSLAAEGHTFIDFGDDRLTVGRPHPMIDQTSRVDRLRRELTDPDCAVVLLDVVLGLGAHVDPAAELAPVIESATTSVVVSLVGTRDDPQGRDATAERLAAAGALVHASNAAATRAALGLVREAAR